jgi:predicted dehydrogenase
MKRNRDRSEKERVSIVLVGIGGYGYYYLRALFEEFSSAEIELRATVDPHPQNSDLADELARRNIPVFDTLDEFYGSGGTCDLVVIASPLHFHVPQSCCALLHGSNVLCDKPAGVTVQEVDRLIETKNRLPGWVMIGYQWSHSRAIQKLKYEIGRGALGKPVRLKSLYLWPRDRDYYRRNDWAGKLRDCEGRWVLDSPAGNGLAHYLHNMFYILGDAPDSSAAPLEVTAELYRAHDIENYDTVACRAVVDGDVEILFYGSHATKETVGPFFTYEFEDGAVDFGSIADEITITDRKGNRKFFGSPDHTDQFYKLHLAVEKVRRFTPPLCPPESARPHTLCVNGIQDSVSEIVTFSESMIDRNPESGKVAVRTLGDALVKCYSKGMLPGEMRLPWARKGRRVDLRNYRFFPGGIKIPMERDPE